MIEIDLLSGGNLSGRSDPSRAPAARRPLPVLLQDPWIVASGLVVVVSVALSAILFISGRAQAAELAMALEAAARDSTRTATLAAGTRSMESRLESVRGRVAAIRNLDSMRYVWPRILDELARALPEEAWLVQIAQVAAEDGKTRFRVEGKTRGNFALSRFWDGIESSDFIGNVHLVSSEHLVEPVHDLRQRGTAYFFVIEGDYQSEPTGPLESAVPVLRPAAP